MSLKDELKALHKAFVLAPVPPPMARELETADELYERVVREMRGRAKAGCRTLEFSWDYVSADTAEEYRAQREVVLEVVRRLTAEGIDAWAPGFANGDEWPEGYWTPYIGGPEFVEPFGIRHHISIDWGGVDSPTRTDIRNQKVRRWGS